MTKSPPRRDALGRARNGSMLQMQIYANQRVDELTRAVLDAAGDSLVASRIEWVSPIAGQTEEAPGYLEFMDEDFLEALRLGDHGEQLKGFWPKSGPRWDALGIASGSSDDAYVLVEAKSYPEEMTSTCMAKSPRSLDLIRRSLEDTKKYYGVDPSVDWLRPYYQYANRLAHVYWLNEIRGRKTVLANVCFVDDHWTSPKPRPTSEAGWRRALGDVKRVLGFTGETIPHVIDVFLPARPDAEMFGTRPFIHPVHRDERD